MQPAARKGRYGIDAPYVPLSMLAGAVLCLILDRVLIHGLWVTAVILLLLAAIYLHTTLRGKFVVWQGLLDDLALRGDEQVLDLGCGRGAVLLLVAARLPRGQAVGVDIWSRHDQSGNGEAMARANAEAAGVAGRIQLHTADMRALPFANASFDLIVSSVAIHNIADAAGRDLAIDQAWRVLRPGGRLLIADISNARSYAAHLRGMGAAVKTRGLGWRMWWGGPWMPTRLVEARKP